MKASSFEDVESNAQNDVSIRHYKYQSSHPLDQIINDISKGIQTRRFVYENFCALFSFLSKLKLDDYKIG